MFSRIILVTALWFASLTVLANETTVIHAGTLLGIPGQDPVAQQTIVVEGERITGVFDGFVEPTSIAMDAQLIDLSDQFVLPGLIDLHVHLLVEIGPDARIRQLTDSDMLSAMHGVANANKTLRAGFTTVRDLGANPAAIYALRDGIVRGYIRGPRIYAAGSPIAATGGHGDVDGVRAQLLEMWTPKTICDGGDDCRRAVRHAVKYGADWIKVTVTGGVLSDTATGLGQQMTDDELDEIMQTAHALGVRVAAHAHGTQGVNAALRAGVDTIDHGTFLDRESMRLFKSQGAYLVPTLMPGHFVPLIMQGNPFFTPSIIAKANLAKVAAKDSFRLALKNGVKIAFGTDTGVTPHGQNAQEFALMVAEGMPAADAIHAATIVAAQVLEASADLGTIEPGKYADIIAVAGNPLLDISQLQHVRAVIKNGVQVRLD